jgi:MoaA/NifB/PqqE/SkfB family radical SAM enzyme
MRLDVLYRGPLSSCNYECWYCPFAKRYESARTLEADRDALVRFVSWAEAVVTPTLGVLVTPWGEALIRSWYREALIRLSHMRHVERVAAQTNGHWELDWLERADLSRLALWLSYHPTQASRSAFVARCHALHALGVRFSVGMVALREHFDDARRLRDELPEGIYLWLNAYKRAGAGYSDADVRFLEAIDPLFRYNVTRHRSLGHDCAAGRMAIAVDGDGTIRRCHFVDQPIGHIDDPSWRECLRPRPCTRRTCECHIGYVHLERLGLSRVFGAGLLERIPASRKAT